MRASPASQIPHSSHSSQIPHGAHIPRRPHWRVALPLVRREAEREQVIVVVLGAGLDRLGKTLNEVTRTPRREGGRWASRGNARMEYLRGRSTKQPLAAPLQKRPAAAIAERLERGAREHAEAAVHAAFPASTANDAPVRRASRLGLETRDVREHQRHVPPDVLRGRAHSEGALRARSAPLRLCLIGRARAP